MKFETRFSVGDKVYAVDRIGAGLTVIGPVEVHTVDICAATKEVLTDGRKGFVRYSLGGAYAQGKAFDELAVFSSHEAALDALEGRGPRADEVRALFARA